MSGIKRGRSPGLEDPGKVETVSQTLEEIEAQVKEYSERLTASVHPSNFKYCETACEVRESIRRRTELYRNTLLKNKVNELEVQLSIVQRNIAQRREMQMEKICQAKSGDELAGSC